MNLRAGFGGQAGQRQPECWVRRPGRTAADSDGRWMLAVLCRTYDEALVAVHSPQRETEEEGALLSAQSVNRPELDGTVNKL